MLEYAAYSLITFLAGSTFVFWLAVTIGLRMRSTFRALLTTIIVLLALSIVQKFTGSNTMAILLNPTSAITLNETNWLKFELKLQGFDQSVYIITNLVIVILWALGLRFYCLTRADRLLGRAG